MFDSSFKEYQSFLNLVDIIENNILCPFCKDHYLISFSPFRLWFLCSKCGKHYTLDVEEI